MAGRYPVGDVAMSGAKGAGSHVSPALAVGHSADVLVMVHVTAASGTSPTLAVSLEESNDGATWTAVPNSAAPTLAAAGNAMTNAATTKGLCRVVAAVGGTTPSFTFRVATLSFAA